MGTRRTIGLPLLTPIVIAAACSSSTREREVMSHAARSNLEKLYDGTASYFASTKHVCATDAARCRELGWPRFPLPSAGPTPPVGSCCARGGACDPEPALWLAEPWDSLDFSVDHRQHYSYQYEVSPDGRSFTGRAIGDLDCDGTYATFTVTGKVDATADGPARAIVIESANELE